LLTRVLETKIVAKYNQKKILIFNNKAKKYKR
jgi:hypothetical protein